MKSTLLSLSHEHHFRQVLDIGAGRGNYIDLLKPILPHSRWTAIEVWAPYVEHFKLQEKYDSIFIINARHWQPLRRYDLVILGDVLEHMPATEAQELVHKLLPVSSLMIISIPIIHMPQAMAYGNPYERHVKDNWSHTEVLNTFPDIISCLAGKSIGVYLLSRDNDMIRCLRQL